MTGRTELPFGLRKHQFPLHLVVGVRQDITRPLLLDEAEAAAVRSRTSSLSEVRPPRQAGPGNPLSTVHRSGNVEKNGRSPSPLPCLGDQVSCQRRLIEAESFLAKDEGTQNKRPSKLTAPGYTAGQLASLKANYGKPPPPRCLAQGLPSAVVLALPSMHQADLAAESGTVLSA